VISEASLKMKMMTMISWLDPIPRGITGYVKCKGVVQVKYCRSNSIDTLNITYNMTLGLARSSRPENSTIAAIMTKQSIYHKRHYKGGVLR
jgi:hypothetical protein